MLLLLWILQGTEAAFSPGILRVIDDIKVVLLVVLCVSDCSEYDTFTGTKMIVYRTVWYLRVVADLLYLLLTYSQHQQYEEYITG